MVPARTKRDTEFMSYSEDIEGGTKEIHHRFLFGQKDLKRVEMTPHSPEVNALQNQLMRKKAISISGTSGVDAHTCNSSCGNILPNSIKEIKDQLRSYIVDLVQKKSRGELSDQEFSQRIAAITESQRWHQNSHGHSSDPISQMLSEIY